LNLTQKKYMKAASFENTVDILVKAYINDTLEHNNCYACAVGNIVAHNMGERFVKATERAMAIAEQLINTAQGITNAINFEIR